MSPIDPKDRRERNKGRPVLYVLIAALVLVLIAGFGMGLFGASQPDENIGGPEAADVETAPQAPAETDEVVVSPGDTPPAPPSAPAPAN